MVDGNRFNQRQVNAGYRFSLKKQARKKMSTAAEVNEKILWMILALISSGSAYARQEGTVAEAKNLRLFFHGNLLTP